MVWTGGAQGDLAPAIEAMFDQADALWPGRSTASDGTLGDQAHASRTSDHNPKIPNPPGWVDAGDLTWDPASGVDLFAISEAIRLRRDPRVKYVIFFAKVFRSYGDHAWEWTDYTGPNAHKSHMHVSILPTDAARSDTSPWFEEADMDLSDKDKQWLRSQLGLDTDLTKPVNLLARIQDALKDPVVSALIADAVVRRLPAAGPGGLTEAQITAAVKAGVVAALKEGVG